MSPSDLTRTTIPPAISLSHLPILPTHSRPRRLQMVTARHMSSNCGLIIALLAHQALTWKRVSRIASRTWSPGFSYAERSVLVSSQES
jgi:hypothetical protein